MYSRVVPPSKLDGLRGWLKLVSTTGHEMRLSVLHEGSVGGLGWVGWVGLSRDSESLI